MLEHLLTEQLNPASASIDALPTEEVLRIINAEDRKVAEAVAAEIPQIARAVDAVAAAISAGGRLFYLGAGTSGRLGVLDASECPPTFSVDPGLVQGIMAGGMDALWNSAETTEDDRPPVSMICNSVVLPPRTCCAALPPAAARPTCWGRWRRPTAWAR